jgi:ankyrin repeat protein
LGESGTEPFVFVSSASADQDVVDRALRVIEDALRHVMCPVSGARYRVVHYAHPVTGTRLGTVLPEEIAKWMWRCRGAILIWSQDFLDSSWCRDIEVPFLAWRREKQQLPLFVLRLEKTVSKSNIISVVDEDGSVSTLDLNLVTDDRNPRENKGTKLARPSVYLPDLDKNDFAERLVAVSEEIARQVDERWRVAASAQPPIAPPLVPIVSTSFDSLPPPPVPLVKWTGDFSSTKSGAISGRDAELRRLTECAKGPDVGIVAVTALGGQGKTALVRAWIETDRDAKFEQTFDSVFAFSFYHGHSQDEFAKELTAFLDPAAPPSEPDTPAPAGLFEMLRCRRILLFLDGLEVIQNKEKNSDEGRVAQGPVLDLLYGLCVDEECKSLAVITSRLRLIGFEEFDGTRLIPFELPGLTPEAGGKLLRDLGVKNTADAKREEYSRDLSGHPLMLRVFADAVKRRALALDFGNAAEKVAEAMALAAPIDLKEKLKRVVASYRNQFGARERAIIEAVAVFGGTATIQIIRAYLRQCNGSVATGDSIANLVEKLITAGILNFRDDGGMHMYSCHPILREGFVPDGAGALSAATISLYSRPAPLKPRTLVEAEPYLEAIRIHAEAGAFKEARTLLARHLAFGDIFEQFSFGKRALLDCLLDFLAPDRRDGAENALGRNFLIATVPRLVQAAIDLDEWEIAEQYARWDSELLRVENKETDALNLSQRARIAAEMGAADDARELYKSAILSSDRDARGLWILESAELERQLGDSRAALDRIRQWVELDQPAASWIVGWSNALKALQYLFERSHPSVALRYYTARRALRKAQSPQDVEDDAYMEWEELELTSRAARTRDVWQRCLELAYLLERNAERFGSRQLGSWPILRAEALNELGRSDEAGAVARRTINQFHARSWRKLWFQIEIARARLLQGQIQRGTQDALQVVNECRLRQRYTVVRAAAELLVEFGPRGVDPAHLAEAQRLLDWLGPRLLLSDMDIPDFGPLPGEAGWEARVSQRILLDVRPIAERETPATQEEFDEALVLAAEIGASGAILELLRLGASSRAVSKTQESALAAAAKLGHEKAVETLLKARTEPFDLEDEGDYAAAIAAMSAGQDVIFQRLLDACAAKNSELLAHLLDYAAMEGSGEAIRVLGKAGADPDKLQDDMHPLVRAARAGNLSAVAALAERIDELDKAADADGETALMAAMGAGHMPVIAWLIDHNAKIDARDGSGRTAADHALQSGQVGALDLLAAMTGRDVLAGIELGTLAVTAALTGRIDLLRHAITRGASIDSVDKLGRTPLVAAAAGGHLDVIRAIRQAAPDVDIDLSGPKGWTALMAAAEAGHEEIVTALVREFGANLDAVDHSDLDVITHALIGNKPNSIRLLASLGALPREIDATITVIRSAAENGNRDALVAFLMTVREAGWMDHLSEHLAL